MRLEEYVGWIDQAAVTRCCAAIVVCLVVVTTVAPLVAGVADRDTGSASVHGFHVSAQPQVVDDAVAIESFFVMRDGFVVVRADDGGTPGRVLGHAPASLGGHQDVSVAIDGGLPPEGDQGTLWVVIHRDADDDGTFDPDDDPPLEVAGSLVGTTFPVERGSQPVVVVAPGLDGQPSNGTVTVRRVSLADRGYVALHDVSDGTTGEVVASTALSAGTHRNVSLDVDEGYFADQPEEFDLRAVAYVDDGDGEFDPESDRMVRVGEEPVGSRVPVRKVADPANDSAGSDDRQDEADPDPVVTATEGGTTVETVDDGGGEPRPTPGVGPVGALLAAALAVAVGTLARRLR